MASESGSRTPWIAIAAIAAVVLVVGIGAVCVLGGLGAALGAIFVSRDSREVRVPAAAARTVADDRWPAPVAVPAPPTVAAPTALALITVESEPSGAEVYVDGRSVGTTPVEVEASASMTVHVEIRLGGYVSEIREMALAPGERSVVHVALARAARRR